MTYTKQITLSLTTEERDALAIVADIFESLYDLERNGEDLREVFESLVDFGEVSDTIDNLLNATE